MWIAEKFEARIPPQVVKVLSDDYYRIPVMQPQIKHVDCLGNYLVLVTPGGTGETSSGNTPTSGASLNLVSPNRFPAES